jgi:hypothetical protein
MRVRARNALRALALTALLRSCAQTADVAEAEAAAAEAAGAGEVPA